MAVCTGLADGLIEDGIAVNRYQKPKPITPEDLMGFMRARSINASCPRCPVVDWRIMESDETRGLAWSIMDGSGTLTSNILPVIPLICRNCGYVWPIARQTVESWMDSRGDNDA